MSAWAGLIDLSGHSVGIDESQMESGLLSLMNTNEITKLGIKKKTFLLT